MRRFFAGAPRRSSNLEPRESIRGEFVVLIAKATEPEPGDIPIGAAIELLVGAGIPRMDAIKTVARERGLPKRDVYKVVNGNSRPKLK